MGKMQEAAYWDFVRKELGVEASNEEIYKLLRDSYEVNPEVRDYVQEVKAKGLNRSYAGVK